MNSGPDEADAGRKGAAAGYVGVGASLRQSRLETGQDVKDLAGILRIRRVYLEAIEEGRFDDLPGQVYATGFVRAYADHLGLDSEWVLDRFREEVDPTDANPDLHFPEPPERSGLRGMWMFVAAAALAAAGYGGWYYMQGVPAAPDAVVAEAPAAALQDAALPGADAEAAAPADGPMAAEPDAADNEAAPPPPSPAEEAEAEAVENAPPAAWTTAGAAAAAPDEEPAEPEPAASPDDPAPERLEIAAAPATPLAAGAGAADDAPAETGDADEAGNADEAAAPPDGGESRVVLRAIRLSWVRVRGADQRTIYARNLQPGETYEVPREEGLTLTVGNAGGLEIVVDGRAIPPLGPEGAPRIGVALDPDALLAERP